jgi:hypothetical protein
MNIASISNGIIATTKTNGNYHMSINSNNYTQDALYSLCPFLGYWIYLSYPFPNSSELSIALKTTFVRSVEVTA